jgi:hypothetical protein
MTETELKRLVAELCSELGLHHHVRPSYRSAPSLRDNLSVPGFPYSVIVGTAILFRELKNRDDWPDRAQRAWGSRITRAGGDWAIWRPADWHSGLIRRQLTEIC